MRNIVLFSYLTYDTLYKEYCAVRSFDVVPIRAGDEFFFWKDEKSVLEFLKHWDTRFSYAEDGGYKQPVVNAKQSGMEQMIRASDTEHPPLLYIRLFKEPQFHPIYNQYIGYGVEHTNVVRTSKTDYGINLIKTKP